MAEPLTSDDPRQVGGYQIRARLGTGGMGQVYLASTPAGRRVALKMVRAEFGDDEQFRARFRQEVAAAQRVHGLFTAQVLDADPDATPPWLATSYVPGLSLRQAVAELGPLPRDTVILLIAGVAEALQAIHAAGIVHRDLKPSNVILAADGPRVIDFGIARAAAAPALTAGGTRVGSPRFMAPEQARSQSVTAAVDVFALGSLAGYASTGHPPFGTDDSLAVLSRVLNEPPQLDGCPPDLRYLIERCLAKDPSRRPRPGGIIDACRDMAGGVLSFEWPWLPTIGYGLTTAAAAPAGPPEPGVVAPGTPDAADSEWTLASETGLPGPSSTRVPLAGTGPRGPSAGGPPRGPREPRRVPSGKTTSLAAAAVVVVIATVGTTAAVLGGPHTAPAGGRGQAAAPGGPAVLAPLRATGPASPRGGRGTPRAPLQLLSTAPSGVSGRAAASSGRAAASAGPVGSSAAAAPSPAPAPAPSAPAPPLAGQAAFAGTWSGTVSEPGWTVGSWAVQLVIPAAGMDGSYSSPSLGCSGTLRITGTTVITMTAHTRTTSAAYPGCVKAAQLSLALAGSGAVDLTWIPDGKNRSPGTALLSSR